MFTIHSLPARFGDAIWVEYGSVTSPHYILIDGGTAGTRHQIAGVLQKTNQPQPHLDLLVITHIDRDHLEGVLGLLEQASPSFMAEEVWFNGFHHLPEDPQEVAFSPMQAERLTTRLAELEWGWNQDFDGGAVRLPDNGISEPITLAGGMKITLLSPTYDALGKLRRQWEKEVNDANLRKGIPLPPNDEAVPEAEISYETPQFPDLEALAETTFQEDDSIANASSIAFIAEYEGCRALFAADAPADGLLAALERIYPAQTVSLDLLKVSHHGSRYTTSLPLIQKLSCPRYLISTNGSIFKHPDQESIARVVKGSREPAQLYFNYLSARNEIWDSEWLKNQYGYSTCFPNPGEQGIAIDLTV